MPWKCASLNIAVDAAVMVKKVPFMCSRQSYEARANQVYILLLSSGVAITQNILSGSAKIQRS